MFLLACEITIGNYRFRQVNNIRITSSWRTLNDTARIQLPNLNKRLQETFRVGDQVVIKLAYEGVYEGEEFKGYVSRISPNIPFVIECEDELFWFKRTNIKKVWRKTSLREVVGYLVDKVNESHALDIGLMDNIPEVQFEKFRIGNSNAAQALQKIKDQYGLVAYFRDGKLFVGLAFTDLLGTVNYSTSWNIIKSNLTFRRAEDVKLKVKAIGITKGNKKIEPDKPIGDRYGDQRTLYFYNIVDKKKLTELAKAELKKLKYEGMEGNFRTFLVPYAAHGMVANLKDPEYNQERAGNYIINTVETTFGTNGARRKVEIGAKV